MSTTTLMDLPGELLEEIFLLLDPVSAIDFGLCTIRLQELLSNHLTFSRILDKVYFEVAEWEEDEEEEEWRIEDNQELVAKISSFICRTTDPAPLLTGLQDTISLQFPAKAGTRLGGGETILLERPLRQPLAVDGEGALLLLHARKGLLLRSVRLGMGSGKVVAGALLEALSCLATQTPGRKLELEVFSLEADTEEDGLALDQLLAACGAWSVENLSLAGRGGGGGGLAGAGKGCC
jgi:hypothetical protein